MFPLNETQPYPFENWWVAARSDEVSRKILGRTILGKRIVLYRTEAGEPVALGGFCPHRAFPLEKAQLVADAVQCPYHGLVFERDGKCSLIPSQPAAPGSLTIRAYPLVERGGVIWIWTGEVANADVSRVPDTDSIGMGVAGWKNTPNPVSTMKARYTLLIDNLMDLSHITFVHAKSIPGAAAVAELPVEIIESPSELNALRIAKGMEADYFIQLLFPGQVKPIDRSFRAYYMGPNLIHTGGWFKDSETGRDLGHMIFVHFVTPETPTSVHYFTYTSYNCADTQELDALLEASNSMALPEDVVVLELIEQGLQSSNTDPREVSFRADSAALRVRRRLAQQIKSEVEARDDRSAAVPVAAA